MSLVLDSVTRIGTRKKDMGKDKHKKRSKKYKI